MILRQALFSLLFMATPVIGFLPSTTLPQQSPNILLKSPVNTRSSQIATVSAVVNGDVPIKAENEGPPNTPNIRLSVEEKAKTVISVCTSGTLCTSSTHDGIEGAPFGSFVDYVLDDEGNPILLMNEMSMHTLNIANDPNGMVTLFAQLDGKSGGGGGAGSPSRGQDVSRCSITGTISKIDPKEADDLNTIRMRYSISHAYADQVMDSPKFVFYRIIPSKVYFVGGFGVLAKWVPVEEYKHAAADILAKEASEIVAKLNRDHISDLTLTATHVMDCGQDIEKIRVTNLDRLGMDIRVTTKGKRRNKLNTDEFRIGFRIPVMSVEDAKSEVLKVFQEAWEKANGYSWGEDEDGSPGSGIPMIKIAADSLG